jgi:CTP synthase
MGIQPDVIVCRSNTPISEGQKRKISNLCDVPVEAVINCADARNIYEIPLVLREEGLDDYVCKLLGLPGEPDMRTWESLVEMIDRATTPVKIGIVGKYVVLPDAYLSVAEALRHGGFHNGAKVEIEWIDSEEITDLLAEARLSHLDGIVLPGGFGSRGIEGKIAAASWARQNDLPCLGLCLGLQMMVIEVARNRAGLEGANSREIDPETPYAVIDLMDEQRNVVDMGGTMRLGAYVAKLAPGSQVEKAYGEPVVFERHRHRYEVNPRFRHRLEEAGLACSGTSPDGRLVEFVEFPGHPFWVGTQAHPEFKSRPDSPHPLFHEFVGAALDRAEGRNPRLPDF